LKGDALINYAIVEKTLHERLTYLDDLDFDRIKDQVAEGDMMIDAIYGTGFKGKAMGTDAQAIRLLAAHPGLVIAADLPSGMEADSGLILGPCVQADCTLTFGLPKLGLYRDPNQFYCGDIEVVDIGLPKALLESEALTHSLMTPAWAARRMPVRVRNSHKGNYGHVFVVGGSRGMTGAVTLACRAALAMGAGLVTAGIPASLHDILEVKLTEAMTKSLPEIQAGDFSQDAGESILRFMKKASVLVIGPGMGTHRSGKDLLNEILPQIQVPVVIDADGLNLVAEIMKDRKDFLKQLAAPLILTPHPGEMARLTGLAIEEIEGDRLKVAKEYAKAWGVVVVLKGVHTVVASQNGEILLNTTGNAGMATGGSGDVLSGMIGALLGQGMSIFEAAGLGVYLHGGAGDAAAIDKCQRSLIASDLIEYLPAVIRETDKL
jgi:NAD(P)H-hydrate epimerase